MPRESIDALLTPKMAKQGPKLEPLDTLGPRQAAVWRATVDALPADYFSSAQTRILAAYCSAVCEREDVEAELVAEKARKRPRAKVIKEKRIELKGWMETENRLARSMRLTHQSVYQQATANTRHKQGKATQGASALQLLNAGRALDAVDAAE
jgi:hypothetical protein